MFRYYSMARRCYVYLFDYRLDYWYDSAGQQAYLGRCRWFTRGWTLQELLAPRNPQSVLFFGARWRFIGTKEVLLDTIHKLTRIDREAILSSRSLKSYSIAQRMSWAANRQTRRIEDRAYSLLGIFDVYMPLIYGEGMKAFSRLQKEIMNISTDQTIFLWTPVDYNTYSLLAPSPDNFSYSADLVEWREPGTHYAYKQSNRGVEITLQILDEVHKWGVLNCRREGNITGPLALKLGRPLSSPSTFREQSATFFAERYPPLQMESDSASNISMQPGITTVLLEDLSKAELTAVTILWDYNAYEYQLDLRDRRRWPAKVFLRTRNEAQHADFRGLDTFPCKSWEGTDIFHPDSSQEREGCKIWRGRRGCFMLALRVPQPLHSIDLENYPAGLHMAIVQHEEIDEIKGADATSSDDTGVTMKSIISELLNATEPVTEISAKVQGWGTVSAIAKFTIRMDQPVYVVDVSIASGEPGLNSEPDWIRDDKEQCE